MTNPSRETENFVDGKLKNLSHALLVASAMLLSGCTTLGAVKVADNSSSPAGTEALAFQANNNFGKSLAEVDRAALTKAEQQALDYGQAGQQIGWKGSSAGIAGTIVASQPFRVGGASCRRFEHTLQGPDGETTSKGTACRRSDGNWKLVN